MTHSLTKHMSSQFGWKSFALEKVAKSSKKGRKQNGYGIMTKINLEKMHKRVRAAHCLHRVLAEQAGKSPLDPMRVLPDDLKIAERIKACEMYLHRLDKANFLLRKIIYRKVKAEYATANREQ